MRTTLYAVLDLVADNLIGGVQLHRHEAAAIRTFGDIANAENSLVHMHPADFALVRLGHLSDTHTVEPDYAVVLTGAQWLAAQQPKAEA